MLFQNTFMSARPWEPSMSFSPAKHRTCQLGKNRSILHSPGDPWGNAYGPPLLPVLQEKVAFGYFDCKMSLQEGFTQTSQLLEPPWHNPQHEHRRGRLGEANINSTLVSGSRKQKGKCQINMKTSQKGISGIWRKKMLLMMRKGVRHVTPPVKGLYTV